MKRVIIIIGITLLPLLMWAQVTGNVKLKDIYNQLETNHSGISVIFNEASQTAVSDSTTTDINGDYSISLVPGTYDVLYRKDGYHFQEFRLQNIPLVSFADTVLNERLQNDSIITQNVSGILRPFTRYQYSYLFDTVFVRVGDTLTIPEGCIFDFNPKSASQPELVLQVEGHLEVIGSDSFPARLIFSEDVSGGYDNSYNASFGSINIINGGSADVSNCIMGKRISFLSATGNISKTEIWPTSGFVIELDNASVSIENSLLVQPDINVGFNSQFDFSCNVITHAFNYIRLSFGANATIKDNYFWGGGEAIRVFDADQVLISNNIFNAGAFRLLNTNSLVNPQVTFTNNLVNDQLEFFRNTSQNGYGEIGYNNNISWDFPRQLPPNITFTKLSHNLYLDSPFPNTLDTIVANNNRFFFVSTVINIATGGFPDFTAPYIELFMDSLLADKGDPTILDSDGSISDIGPTFITTCTNSFNPLPAVPDTTVPNPTVIDSVFPGDCNHNGIANNFDLLPIGLYYGQTGGVRPGATTNWIGQDAPDWGANQSSGYDIKHIDANGDGSIDNGDVAAINLNYRQTHNNFKSQIGGGLWFQFPLDSIFQGDTIDIKIMLGQPNQPIGNVYGLAFTMNYDSSFIVPGSAEMTFDSTWLGEDSVDLISLYHENLADLSIDVGLSRIDGIRKTGDGQIGTLTVVMNDDILGKDPILVSEMSFSNILAIDEQENVLQVGGDAATFYVIAGERAVGINELDMALRVFPNPAKDMLIIDALGIDLELIELWDINGRLVKTDTNPSSRLVTLTTDNLETGIYILKVISSEGTATRRVQVIK